MAENRVTGGWWSAIPKVDAGFSKRPRSNKKIERDDDLKKSHSAKSRSAREPFRFRLNRNEAPVFYLMRFLCAFPARTDFHSWIQSESMLRPNTPEAQKNAASPKGSGVLIDHDT